MRSKCPCLKLLTTYPGMVARHHPRVETLHSVDDRGFVLDRGLDNCLSLLLFLLFFRLFVRSFVRLLVRSFGRSVGRSVDQSIDRSFVLFSFRVFLSTFLSFLTFSCNLSCASNEIGLRLPAACSLPRYATVMNHKLTYLNPSSMMPKMVTSASFVL